MKGIIGVIVALVVIGAIINSGHKKSSGGSTAPPAAAKAQFELIVSQSSCQETPSQASINCSVGVKNRGDTAGQPTVYATYFYNDSGTSADESDNGACRANDAIPPGQLGYVYFCHPYNALQHDMVRAAVTLKIDANSSPYVRVADPGDTNWP